MLSSAKWGLNLVPMFHPVSQTLSYCTNIQINNIKHYYTTSSASGQDEPNLAL